MRSWLSAALGGVVGALLAGATTVGALSVSGRGFPLRAPDGSLGAPSYAFASNPGTGLRVDLSGSRLRLDVNGASIFNITQGGFSTNAAFQNNSAEGIAQTVAAAAQANPAANQVRLYIDEGTDRGGAVAPDCALVARLNSGTEIVVATLVTDAGCP